LADNAGGLVLILGGDFWPSSIRISEADAVKTLTLHRPIGPKELQLIEQSGWTKFPPRLPEQPIFYPVMNEASHSLDVVHIRPRQ
jgi:hypothetical protein